MKEAHCRCWTEPARVHSGHCCMATADLWCHQVEGMAALTKQEEESAADDVRRIIGNQWPIAPTTPKEDQ